MKNKLVGLISIALLLGGTVGYAANASLIGSKVTGIYTIQQDGKKVAEAVVINGSAYMPVRAMSEVTGAELVVEGKTITMTSKALVEDVKETSQRVMTEAEKEVLRDRLAAGEAAVKKYKEVIAQTEGEIALETDPEKIKGMQDFITDLKNRITAAEVINSDTKVRLGE